MVNDPGHYYELGRLMNVKKADKKLEKIAREVWFDELKDKIKRTFYHLIGKEYKNYN